MFLSDVMEYFLFGLDSASGLFVMLLGAVLCGFGYRARRIFGALIGLCGGMGLSYILLKEIVRSTGVLLAICAAVALMAFAFFYHFKTLGYMLFHLSLWYFIPTVFNMPGWLCILAAIAGCIVALRYRRILTIAGTAIAGALLFAFGLLGVISIRQAAIGLSVAFAASLFLGVLLQLTFRRIRFHTLRLGSLSAEKQRQSGWIGRWIGPSYLLKPVQYHDRAARPVHFFINATIVLASAGLVLFLLYIAGTQQLSRFAALMSEVTTYLMPVCKIVLTPITRFYLSADQAVFTPTLYAILVIAVLAFKSAMVIRMAGYCTRLVKGELRVDKLQVRLILLTAIFSGSIVLLIAAIAIAITANCNHHPSSFTPIVVAAALFESGMAFVGSEFPRIFVLHGAVTFDTLVLPYFLFCAIWCLLPFSAAAFVIKGVFPFLRHCDLELYQPEEVAAKENTVVQPQAQDLAAMAPLPSAAAWELPVDPLEQLEFYARLLQTKLITSDQFKQLRKITMGRIT